MLDTRNTEAGWTQYELPRILWSWSKEFSVVTTSSTEFLFVGKLVSFYDKSRTIGADGRQTV